MQQTSITSPRPAELSCSTLCRCFLRSYFLLAGINTKGMQNIGFSIAIDPALQDLYPVPADLQEARLRYSPHFNCHPFLTPYILGVFIHCEKTIISGRLPVDTYNTVRNTYMYTLSVIGDNLFSGGIYITLSLLMCIFLLGGSLYGALGVLFLGLLGLHALKLWTFSMGLRSGLGSMQWLERLRLVNFAEKCKYINAGLLTIIFYYISKPFFIGGLPHIPFIVLCLLFIFVYIQNKIRVSRIIGSFVFFVTVSIFTYLTFSI